MTGTIHRLRAAGLPSSPEPQTRAPERPDDKPRGTRWTIAAARPARGSVAATRPEGVQIADLCVIGLGYIGLPTATVFAASGLSVAGVDIDPDRVAGVNAGTAGLGEAGLEGMVAAAVAEGRLTAGAEPAAARAYIIAVPTPLTPAKQPDLSHVHAAAAALAPHLARGALVVLESTVPVGATERLAAQLAVARPDLSFPGGGAARPDVLVAHCPERVLPGRILEELRGNDRVIGGLDRASTEAAARLFGRISGGTCHPTDAATAEMTKLAENAYRDVNIAFANELALIAEAHGIDARAVIGMANRHPRVDILQPGPGVGGHCIAVDPWFLAASGRGRSRLIPMARAVNDARPSQVAARALEMVADLPEPVIACLGLTYKRDVADLRESPALKAVRLLAERCPGRVLAVDPHVGALPPGLDGAALVDAATALARADLVVLLVDHADFAGLIRSLPHRAQVLDTRGLWDGVVQKDRQKGRPDAVADDGAGSWAAPGVGQPAADRSAMYALPGAE